jgi:glycogen debranching enzyme
VTGETERARQPLLHDRSIALRAPTQVWAAPSGRIGEHPIDGIYFSDVRIVAHCEVRFDGHPAETIATVPRGADSTDHIGVLRYLDGLGADPRVRVTHRRDVLVDGVNETVTISSALDHAVLVGIAVTFDSDMVGMDAVKQGERADSVPLVVGAAMATWERAGVAVTVESDGGDWLERENRSAEVRWSTSVPGHGDASVRWHVRAVDPAAALTAPATASDWLVPAGSSGDDRLDRWVDRALADLDVLRMSTSRDPTRSFLAAGAPWFFTLFGRDSIWATRFLLPLGGSLAADTLTVLAGMQGTSDDPVTAEQPGKIMHELRRRPQRLTAAGPPLPPLYYGTVDATPLWICLLCDAADWGMSDAELVGLLPHLEAALTWMRDYGDSDGDGVLEYIDRSGHGLTNQGWKDSGDSVQWRDGRLASGPIALCEVQAYAYEAAVRGAELLERFGRGGAEWRQWAAGVKAQFDARFWIDDASGAYPAIALDGTKRAVDGVTSNIGHLLGTGLLDQDQSELVARRLVSPEMSSGFGLRTMATDSTGYWPLSYHGGSVWAHDTAIAIRGLTMAGFATEAAELTEGMLRAAVSFDYRMPELHSGDAFPDFSRAVPYPAACRPQAWSAAAAISIRSSMLGIRPHR